MQRLPRARTVEAASPMICATSMLDALPKVMWFIRRHMRQNRTRGMSIPQFRTLALLDGHPTASLSVVAENLGASLPTASRIVGGMVKKGLITRTTCEDDRRQCSLKLTALGQSAFDTGRRATEERLAGELVGLSESDRACLIEAMRSLSGLFGQDRTSETSKSATG